MKLLFKNTTERGEYPVDVALYNRAGERLAFDYDQCKKQIFIEGVTITQARWMIKEIESYIRDKMSLEAGAEEKIKVSSHEPIQQGADSGQLQQHVVMESVCVSCDEKKPTHELCMLIADNQKQTAP